MSSLEKSGVKEDLQKLVQGIQDLAEESKDNIFEVLFILRELESLHRNIRTEMFEPNLPDTRHRLYLLIKHLEEIGGWPYIERMRLRDICASLQIDVSQSSQSKEESPSE